MNVLLSNIDNYLIKVVETESYLKALLEKDKMYKYILNIDNLDTWKKNINDIWIVAYKYKQPYGLLLLREFSGDIMTYHGGIYKESRGIDSPMIVKSILNQIKKLIPDYTLMTTIPRSNRLAIRLVRLMGMKEKALLNTKNNNYILFSEN